MTSGKEFNDILDACLECILVEGETVEWCLQKYPEHAAKLEPLLKMAVATNKALITQPDPEFKARARYEFNLLLHKIKPRRPARFLSWRSRWVMVTASLVIVLLLTGGSTALAADHIMPGNPLYPVKLTTEQVGLTFTTSDIAKAELCAILADRRVAEIDYVISKGKHRLVEQTAERLNKHLTMMAGLHLGKGPEITPREGPARGRMDKKGQVTAMPGNGRGKLRGLLGRYSVNHPTKLQALLEKVPDSAKPALRRAIEKSTTSYQKALKDLD